MQKIIALAQDFSAHFRMQAHLASVNNSIHPRKGSPKFGVQVAHETDPKTKRVPGMTIKMISSIVRILVACTFCLQFGRWRMAEPLLTIFFRKIVFKKPFKKRNSSLYRKRRQ